MAIKYPSAEERLWAKVDKVSSPHGCWLWTGSTAQGYGHLQRNGKNVKVHRLSYELEYGEIPEGYDVCHNCPGGDNPRCVRPTHLWLGSHADNMADMKNKKRHRSPYKGELNPKAKLTAEKVKEIRELYSRGTKQLELANKYAVSNALISYIVTKKQWKHIS